MSSPKNCMSLSFGAEVLLLKKARTSCIPWLIRDTNARDMTVDPELYSTTVSDFSGWTSLVNMFNAGAVLAMYAADYARLLRTYQA